MTWSVVVVVVIVVFQRIYIIAAPIASAVQSSTSPWKPDPGRTGGQIMMYTPGCSDVMKPRRHVVGIVGISFRNEHGVEPERQKQPQLWGTYCQDGQQRVEQKYGFNLFS